ncbi:MAG: beta-ketoacyl-ACP synthase III [Cellvibrionaceae bacterium]|nr:beta-ketoacyl-ACP synthase III [Cellvibrionaceae bacterium]
MTDVYNAYLTSTGRFLPGPPINNDQIEDHLGRVHGKPSRLKAKILASNGIKTRHYAIDKLQQTQYLNCDMGANAARDCLQRCGLRVSEIEMLAAATSQGDLVLPGFGSMLQAAMELPDIELLTAHGICSSSLMALKSAANAIRLGEHSKALVVASEFASRLFKASRYEALDKHYGQDFNAEFLRWMLSDGAGAVLLENAPRGRCLQIEWIKSFSHADAFPVCMSVGQAKDGRQSWQDYPSYAEAEAAGALLLRQDVRLLDNMVKLGVDGFLRLLASELVTVSSIDHVLCHYSSDFFRSKIFDLLSAAGAMVPEERWYTNLYERGNTGCASIFIMLDEFLRSRKPAPGEKVFCMVPESGRFNTAYMLLNVVDANA